jgi:hypothetical protein
MGMRIFLAAILPVFVALPTFHGLGVAQGGDQFLDGIGETALVARYVCNGNTEDSSRNHFHAALRGSGGAFIEDPRFGRVLELAGNGGYIELPGRALAGVDTISVTAWLYLPTGASGPLFDFGQGASARIVAGLSAAGFRATVSSTWQSCSTRPVASWRPTSTGRGSGVPRTSVLLRRS